MCQTSQLSVWPWQNFSVVTISDTIKSNKCKTLCDSRTHLAFCHTTFGDLDYISRSKQNQTIGKSNSWYFSLKLYRYWCRYIYIIQFSQHTPCSEIVTQKQQIPKLPLVTLTWHARYKYPINYSTEGGLSNSNLFALLNTWTALCI